MGGRAKRLTQEMRDVSLIGDYRSNIILPCIPLLITKKKKLIKNIVSRGDISLNSQLLIFLFQILSLNLKL